VAGSAVISGGRAAAPSAGLSPLAGGALAIIALALALGTFMQVLDTTIANVSIPTISGNLGVSVDQGAWVITLFAMSNGVSVPLTGWLMGRYGVVKTFVVSVLLFTIASFLCGLAWDLPSLLAFRILQGAVSGPMIPGSQALLISIFPPTKRATALGIWAITTLVAPICGPIMGGWISDNLVWRWIFLINLPIGAFCVLICWRGLRTRETPTRRLPIDTVGFLLLAVWVGVLQVMLDTGKDADWFSSPMIVVEAIVAAVAFVAWLIWELTEKYPIVDLSLFRSKNFALGSLVFCSAYAVFFGTNLLQPLWLQTQLGYIATWAGLVAAPSGLVAVVCAPLMARFGSKFDARITGSFAMLAFALSFFMRSRLPFDASFGVLVIPMLVQGVAMSTFFVSLITIQLRDVSQAQTPAATGLSNFTRITAGGFAASLVTTIWDRREAVHQTQLSAAPTSHAAVWDQAYAALQGAGVGIQQAVGVLAHQIQVQAYTEAALDLFWAAGWLSLMMVPLIWLTRRSMSDGASVAAD
jgi:DHA2 family multidrug resistance protein